MTKQDWLSCIERKYNDMLHLTANENRMSALAEEVFKSSLYSRYRMGSGNSEIFTSGNFAAKAMPEVSTIIEKAEECLKEMLHAQEVNLNFLSGVHAMMSCIMVMTNPGDTVMTVVSRHGGHFCTKGILERSGRKQIDTVYDFDNLTFDVDRIAEAFKESGASAIYLDTSVLLQKHPIQNLRSVLGDKATIIYDASHTLGLIMGGQFQMPLDEGADVIIANTHKTLPGPPHGLIAFKDKSVGRIANELLRKSFYSSTHIHEILALCITILEMHKWGHDYARCIIQNANILGAEMKKLGASMRSLNNGIYSETHQLHRYIDVDNKKAVSMFLDNAISINTSKALGDQLFVRIGLQEITRRGMGAAEMCNIAQFFQDTLSGKNIKKKVIEFSRSFPTIHFGFNSFDEIEV